MTLTTTSTVLTIVLAVWLVTLGRSIIIMLCGKKLFKKANVSEKSAFIPIINLFSILEIADASTFWGILLFVPGLNIIVLSIMSFKLGSVFNVSTGFKLGLVFIPIVFYPLLSMSNKPYKLSDEEYFRGIENSTTQKLILPESNNTEEVVKKVEVKEIEEKKPEVDSIFKSNVQMMEKVAPYKAAKIDLLGMDKLEELDMQPNEPPKVDESKLLTDDDFKQPDSNKDDMEIVDL